jgi:hypothetical protein
MLEKWDPQNVDNKIIFLVLEKHLIIPVRKYQRASHKSHPASWSEVYRHDGCDNVGVPKGDYGGWTLNHNRQCLQNTYKFGFGLWNMYWMEIEGNIPGSKALNEYWYIHNVSTWYPKTWPIFPIRIVIIHDLVRLFIPAFVIWEPWQRLDSATESMNHFVSVR